MPRARKILRVGVPPCETCRQEPGAGRLKVNTNSNNDEGDYLEIRRALVQITSDLLYRGEVMISSTTCAVPPQPPQTANNVPPCCSSPVVVHLPLSLPSVIRPLQDRFNDAQLGVARGSSTLSTDVQLAFYGLFKQAKVGDLNVSRPWAVDVAGRAKYDSWFSHKGLPREEAMEKYCDLWGKLLKR